MKAGRRKPCLRRMLERDMLECEEYIQCEKNFAIFEK